MDLTHLNPCFLGCCENKMEAEKTMNAILKSQMKAGIKI